MNRRDTRSPRGRGRGGSGRGRATAPATYLSTFPAGLGALVQSGLETDLGRVGVEYADDSALVYRASAGAQPGSLPYLKNSFRVLLRAPRKQIDRAAREFAQRIEAGDIARDELGGMRSFRLMAQVDGQLTPVAVPARQQLERAIRTRFGATLDARGGTGSELWLLARRDLPDLVLAVRLPRPKRPAAAAGSLSSELSHLLVRASRPHPNDVFLDPFGGSGALAQARAASPAKTIVSSDLAGPDDGKRGAITWLAEDGLVLPSFADGSVDALVTDPPWGEHEDLPMPVEKFYARLAATVQRVLNPRRGRAVLLVTRSLEQVATDALRGAGLDVADPVQILVNGHPASVLLARP